MAESIADEIDWMLDEGIVSLSGTVLHHDA